MPKKRKPKATRVRRVKTACAFDGKIPKAIARNVSDARAFRKTFGWTIRPVTITWHEPRGK